MADLKDEFNPTTVATTAALFAAAWPAFPAVEFCARATDGLEGRRLSERVELIADALVATLPAEFTEAAALIDAVLGDPGFAGWLAMPVGMFVARAGLERPEVALPLLAALTPRFSSEFPIRAFIVAHPAVTLEHLRRWVQHPDEHVRRLVSEGTRARLPWAPQLKAFMADPSPVLPLLDALYDDESVYVRRSVANHLNDISKDHPVLAVEIGRRWSAANPGRIEVVRHGLRSLVKRGDPDALAVLGFAHGDDVRLLRLSIEPHQVRIGEAVTVSFGLAADQQTRVAVDYAVHYQGVAGRKAPKVFKLTTKTLPPGEAVRFEKRHRLEHVSIRRIHPGAHRIDIQVNGRVLGGMEFMVTDG